MANEAETRAILERWFPLWTGNRPEALAGCYAEDVFYRDPARPEGIRGRPALLEYFRRLLARNPDWRWELDEFFPIEGGCTVRYRATIPVGGTVVRETGLDLLWIRDGLITRNEVYFDRSALLRAMRES